jgi:putative cardiolipin synthase
VLVADAPEKAESPGNRRGLRMAPTLAATINAAQHDLLMISPYFIPSTANVDDLLALTGRGVSVSVLTNSLAATDEPAVYAKYAPHRKPLLAGAVKLYELRPEAGTVAVERQHGQSSGVSLHANALVVDDHTTFIGSMNLDPRSALVNTEMGLIVDNVALAKAVTDFFALATRPENSFELQLERGSGRTKGPGHIVWLVNDGGKVRRVEDEPETKASLRLKMRLLRLLPIDGLL